MLREKYRLTEKGKFLTTRDFSRLAGLRRTVMMELLYGPSDTVTLEYFTETSSRPYASKIYKEAFQDLLDLGYIMKDPETVVKRRLSGYSS